MTSTETNAISSETETKTIAETPVAEESNVLDSAPIDDEALADVSGGVAGTNSGGSGTGKLHY